MSAICGVFYLNAQPVTAAVINRMTQILAHRGADGSGTWYSESTGFGHQMMYITPESCYEKLPCEDKLSQLVITADARLDNREELFEKLKIHRSERREFPDSRIILELYKRRGDECVTELLGDFVFAIWDGKVQRLFCATDPVGSRSLFYYKSKHIFAFASEVKSILTLPDVAGQFNEQKLAAYSSFATRLRFRTHTFWTGIYQLPAATSVTITPDKMVQRTYWQPELSDKFSGNKDCEYIEIFREIFSKAVAARMRSVYPAAIQLSGGLDSSAIACVASRLRQEQNQQLFAVSSVVNKGFACDKPDERPFIEIVAEQAQIDVVYVTPEYEKTYADLDQLFFQSEDPLISPRHYLYRSLYEAASACGARTILDGCGGELGPSFNGDGYLAQLAVQGHWLRLGLEIHKRGIVENRKMRHIVKAEILPIMFPRIGHRPNENQIKLMSRENSIFNPAFFEKMNFDGQAAKGRMIDFFRVLPDARRNILKRMQIGFPSGNPMGISQNLDVRFPFLDKRLLEFSLAVPAHLFAQNGWKRNLIRSGLDGILPPEIQWRQTKGPFSPDYYFRLKKNWQIAWDCVNSVAPDEKINEYLDIVKIKKVMSEYKNKPSWTPAKGSDAAMLMIQPGVHLIRFLRWFVSFNP